MKLYLKKQFANAGLRENYLVNDFCWSCGNIVIL